MSGPRLSELSLVQKEAAKQKAQGFSEQRRVLGVSCNNMSNWGWRYKWQGGYSRGLPVVRNCKAVCTESRETSRSNRRIFWRSKWSSVRSGLTGRKWVREPNVRVSKMFNLNRREIRIPEYRRGIKDPSTTHRRRAPVSHTAKLVKQVWMTRLNFGQWVGKGATYRQWALIPTCNALDLIIH